MREITAHKRIVSPADLAGLKMRVPAGQLVADTFKAFGCEPVIINSDSIYAALKDGRADAQENPLTLADQFKLYEVVKYVAMTDHMWSGFNLLAHLPTWQRLPADLQAVIDRNVTKHVKLQRQDQIAANTRLRTELAARGLEFNTPDPGPFKKQLAERLRDVEGEAGNEVLEVARGQHGVPGVSSCREGGITCAFGPVDFGFPYW